MHMEVLSADGVERIHTRTAQLLEETGFRVEHEGLRRRAAGAGARVDDATRIVRLPQPLLTELLAKAPPRYTVRGVAGDSWTIGGDEQWVSAIVTDPWILDYPSGRPRRPNLADVRTHTVLTQRNPAVAQVSRMDFPVTDVDGPASSPRALEEHLLHHTKHSAVYAGSEEGFAQWMELGGLLAEAAGIAAGELLSTAVAVVSPLTLSPMNAMILERAAGMRSPVVPTVCPMAGTTGPYTLDGTLLLGNAENVFLAAMTQLIEPGAPFLYTLGASVSDLRSGHDQYYTFDKVLWKLAAVELARAYGLPALAECGGTMPPRYDMQAGAESMAFMLAAVNSGAAVLSGIGSCYNANGLSAEMIVIQGAWLDAARHLARGICLDELDRSADRIAQAGPGGNFLTDELTLEFMSGGQFFDHPLLDLSGSADGRPLLERAHERVEELARDFESPVPGTVAETIRRYFHDLYAKLEAA